MLYCNDEQGFTLLEMMVVIMIIGLLAGLIVPNLLANKDKADQKKAIADIVALENAIALYQMDNGSIPTKEEGLSALVRKPNSLQSSGTWTQGYIRRLPDDPWHHPYRYSVPGRDGNFDIFTLGADNQPGGEGVNQDIGTWNVNNF
ncbi:type II secretion system major pseudopilin GspG [Salmonella enterica]